MKYVSTRGFDNNLKSAEVIKKGLASDGGLYVPKTLPKIKKSEIELMMDLPYPERACLILRKFLTDFTDDEIRECAESAYSNKNFNNEKIAPLYKLNGHVHILELWHGPTGAFKDLALQIMPYLMQLAIKKSHEKEKTLILVATSGDTGKAALEGFKNFKGIEIVVFYPEHGVSQVQKMQMVTQTGDNVHVYAVEGNFDDAQNGVKEIFTNDKLIDEIYKKGYKFSSANSINWGRLVPQIIYYLSAYVDLLKDNEIDFGDKINIVVPTGNFGNILAAYYAKHMGLPVNRLICASNINNILTDFIKTGTYNMNREFIKTISPSMDILISSNLERLLYELSGQNSKLIASLMNDLKEKGSFSVPESLRKDIANEFWADYTTEGETRTTIKSIYNEYKYVIDTHTAVGVDVYDKYIISTHDLSKTVIASTASPFKFNKSVMEALYGKNSIQNKSEFVLVKELEEKTGVDVPEGLKNLENKEIRFKKVCLKNEMKDMVLNSLK